jgi:hypothetical protein
MTFRLAGLFCLVWVPLHAQPVAGTVREEARLALHSAFWPNLHNLLWAEAWARRPAAAAEPSPAGSLPEPLAGELTAAERAAWDAALDYYDREIADLHPLFDPESATIRAATIAAGAELPAAGIAAEHYRVLTAAAPVYRKYWWPAHDRANREWIAEAGARLAALSPAAGDRLGALLGATWFNAPIRVDVVRVTGREGAFTALNPAPGHVTVASGHAAIRDWAAAEVLLHEASHLLMVPTITAFNAELKAQGKDVRRGPPESWNGNVWHVALFFTASEVVRQALAAKDISYQAFADRIGLFDRAYQQLRAPVETHWKRYVNGEVSFADAVKQTVAAIP